HRFLGERGEHDLAALTVWHNLAGFRINDFRVEVVLPDIEAIFGLHAFAGHAGPNNLGQAVGVDGMDVERALDLCAHRVAPWFCTAKGDLERCRRGIEPLGSKLVEDDEEVGGRWYDDIRLKIQNELDLTLGHAACNWYHHATQPLGTKVHAETAREQ